MVYSIRYVEVYQVAPTRQKQVGEPQTKWVRQASKQVTPLLRPARGKWMTISGSNLRPTSLKLPTRMPHESTETGCQQPRQHAGKEAFDETNVGTFDEKKIANETPQRQRNDLPMQHTNCNQNAVVYLKCPRQITRYHRAQNKLATGGAT